MPLISMARAGANNLGQPFQIASSRPSGTELLETIGTYIPTEVTTLYIAAAGAIAGITPQPTDDFKKMVVIAFAVLSGFAMWVLIHREAQKKVTNPSDPRPKPADTLKGGWYEILAAPLAFAIWAAAMPDSWFDWGPLAVVGPAAVVGIATVVIGGIAVLLNRNKA